MGHKNTIDIRCNICSVIIAAPGLCNACAIDQEAEREYPDVSIDLCTGPLEQEKLNSIQKKLREAYKKGAAMVAKQTLNQMIS